MNSRDVHLSTFDRASAWAAASNGFGGGRQLAQ